MLANSFMLKSQRAPGFHPEEHLLLSSKKALLALWWIHCVSLVKLRARLHQLLSIRDRPCGTATPQLLTLPLSPKPGDAFKRLKEAQEELKQSQGLTFPNCLSHFVQCMCYAYNQTNKHELLPKHPDPDLSLFTCCDCNEESTAQFSDGPSEGPQSATPFMATSLSSMRKSTVGLEEARALLRRLAAPFRFSSIGPLTRLGPRALGVCKPWPWQARRS